MIMNEYKLEPGYTAGSCIQAYLSLVRRDWILRILIWTIPTIGRWAVGSGIDYCELMPNERTKVNGQGILQLCQNQHN